MTHVSKEIEVTNLDLNSLNGIYIAELEHLTLLVREGQDRRAIVGSLGPGMLNHQVLQPSGLGLWEFLQNGRPAETCDRESKDVVAADFRYNHRVAKGIRVQGTAALEDQGGGIDQLTEGEIHDTSYNDILPGHSLDRPLQRLCSY